MYAHTMTIEELEQRIGELRSDLRGYERAIEAGHDDAIAPFRAVWRALRVLITEQRRRHP